jgi:hypothetical protein
VVLVIVELGVLDEGAKLDGVENVWLLFARQAVALGVAAALNVEYVGVGPYVFVVSDERALRVTGQGSLARSRETKQDSGVSFGANVGGAVHGEGSALGHVVVHDAKDTFFHLAGVGGAQDDLLLRGEVHVDRGFVGNIVQLASDEFSGVNNREVGARLEIFLNGRLIVADKHILHEESVVGPGTNDAGLDLVLLVPACVVVNHEDARAHVEVVDGSLLVESERFRGHRNVDFAPVYFLQTQIMSGRLHRESRRQARYACL